MEIDSIELRKINLPFKTPFITSGWEQKANNSVIIKITSGKFSGWGESAVSIHPWYLPETASSVFSIITDSLAPLLFKQDLTSPLSVEKIFAHVKGNNAAKAGIEFAVWDLYGRINNTSLSAMLGGTLNKIPVGVTIGVAGNIEELVNTVEGYLDEGYKRIKLKIKPGFDIEPVKLLRKKFPDLLLQVDANSAYSLKDMDQLKRLDEYDLLMIEQPFDEDDIAAHAELQKNINTPVCLDESITSLKKLELAVKMDAARIITIKAARCGGLTAAKNYYNYCMNAGIPLWCGGLLETGIGRAVNVSFASLPGFMLPGDISANGKYFEKDIVTNPFIMNPEGTLNVPHLPGHGADVDEDFLNYVTVEKKIILPQ